MGARYISKRNYWWLQEFLDERNENRNIHIYTLSIKEDSYLIYFSYHKVCQMSNTWQPLTPEEEDALEQAFRDYLDRKESASNAPKCVCPIDRMMRIGCKCGAFKAEMEELEEKEKEIDRKVKKALKEGMTYEQRVKKWGRG